MRIRCVQTLWLLVWAVMASSAGAGTPAVNESARQIPVAYQVDVVVVGGSTGAVSAAVAAAQAGAKVFLAAPRPYLGDDMTATLRLWLEEGEKPTAPLAKKIFCDDIHNPQLPDPNRIDFSYQADLPSAGVHQDTQPPRMLSDGGWGDVFKQTVQYDGDANIIADLRKTQEIEKVRMMVHRGGGTSAYKVQSVTVSTSDDKKAWKKAAVLKSSESGIGGRCIVLSAPLRTKARYVKFAVKRTPDANRVLISEIEIIAPGPPGEKRPVVDYRPPRPMHVKKTLDEALLAAGVPFLYSCYATDVLQDARGNPCGIVMANRAGRQAVVAKTIIDATDRAVVARMAGAAFRPFPGGKQTLNRVVIGGQVKTGRQMTARTIYPPFRGPFPNQAKTSSGSFPIIEYTLELPVEADTPAAWAAADQQARDMTYDPEQQFTADVFFQVPPDPIDGRTTAEGPWQGVENLPLGAFRPKDVPRVFVLGGCAGISRQQAEKLLRPLALIDMGTRVGKAAAAEAGSLAVPSGVKLPGQPTTEPAAKGDVGEALVGVRPHQELPSVPQDARELPVLGRYDVVVIGGGTAGAPAGIAAARQGAKTLVVEYLYGLGGVGTTGAISTYCHGNRVGFTAEVGGGKATWVIEQRMEWWRSMLRKAGGDLWFGTIGCGAFVDGRRVAGAVVATPQGRGVVLAKVVIDATGNADVAAAAGVECRYTDHSELAMQGTGLPPRMLGATYTNTDYTYSDETDMVDVWALFLYAKKKYPTAFDLGQLVDTRERRRIVGDYTLTLLDQMDLRTFPDSICLAITGYDTHGYIIDPYLLLKHPLRKRHKSYIPYRCLLPKGFEGMLVVGLGVSAHRDAIPIIRMQPDVQNTGYAAGVSAAMATKAGVDLREIDVRKLQKHLVEIGNLPESVLSDEDPYPLPPERIAAAVETIKGESQGLAKILAHPRQALPMLRKAHAAAEGEHKLAYAKILGMLGDPTGFETLVAEVEQAAQWDDVPRWNISTDYEGYRRVGWGMSNLDNTIVAMGRTGRREAVPVVLKMLKLLTPASPFSHHRSVSLALEAIGDRSAAKPLAELLSQEDMTGYVVSEEGLREELAESGTSPARNRSRSVRELALARALYRCGDYDGLAEKILAAYANDVRGHFARHARAVLQAGNQPKP